MSDEKLGMCAHGGKAHAKWHQKYLECVNWREQPAPGEPRKEAPIYMKFRHDEGKYNHNYSGTPLYGISCNEGWRESIVCTNMYDWAADWLLTVLERKPYAPGKH